jgi:hypothetical protein
LFAAAVSRHLQFVFALAVGLGSVAIAELGPLWLVPPTWLLLVAIMARWPETRRGDLLPYAAISLTLLLVINLWD